MQLMGVLSEVTCSHVEVWEVNMNVEIVVCKNSEIDILRNIIDVTHHIYKFSRASIRPSIPYRIQRSSYNKPSDNILKSVHTNEIEFLVRRTAFRRSERMGAYKVSK